MEDATYAANAMSSHTARIGPADRAARVSTIAETYPRGGEFYAY